jgi:hypothetical protein
MGAMVEKWERKRCGTRERDEGEAMIGAKSWRDEGEVGKRRWLWW